MPDRPEQRTDTAAADAPIVGVTEDPPPDSGAPRLWRVGRTAWALVGIGLAVVALGMIAGRLTLVIIPLILALFPATLLVPVANWLQRRGLPDSAAGLLAIIGGIALIGAVVGAMVPLVAAEIPDLVESATDGVAEIEQLLQDGPFGLETGGVEELLSTAREQLGEFGDIAGQATGAAFAAFEVLAGLVVLFVVLFFYLKDGPRLAEGVISTLPARTQPRVRRLAFGSWETLGRYFRGQLLVALADAILIGIGLLVLGVPLALPLAVLIFFGGLFPIVGAVASGTLAVLVGLADGGLTTALIVLGLVLLVQQLEGNVLQPFILGRAIELHPLVIILAITAGSLLLGILGAFLAVPTTAIVARIVADLRGLTDEADEGTAQSEDGADPSTSPAGA